MEEEKILKPPFGFTFQLFVLMLFLILQFFRLYDGMPSGYNDSLSEYKFSTLFLSCLTDVLLYTYAFVGIFKVLQRKSQSITILKFSLFYLILQSFFSVTSDISGDIRNMVVLWLHPLSLMFYIYMYIYLFKSNKLKEFIPKNERKFGLAGIIGIVIYILSVGLFTCSFSSSFYKGFKSLPINTSEIKLNQGEYSDGLVVFKPLDGWKCDTVYKVSEYNYLHIFNSNQYSDIIVTTVPGLCTNKSEYYFLLSQCFNEYIGDSIKLDEISYGDTLINGNRLYYNTYLIKQISKEENIYWTFSALIPNDFNKIFTISCTEKGSTTFQKNIDAIFKNVDFDLEKRRTVNN